MSTFHSLEAEQAVLGSLLIDANTYARVAPILAVADFHRAEHQIIFRAIGAVVRGGAAPDVVMVHEELKRRGNDQEAGGLAYLSELARNTATAANAEHYATAVRDRAVARDGREATEQFSAALENGQAPKEALAALEQRLTALKSRTEPAASHALRSIGIGDFLQLEIPARGNLLAPILPEQGLVMVYGPRGLGKTHLSVGIGVAVASGGTFLRWSAPKPSRVLFIDGEMPAASIQKRMADAIRSSDKEPRHDMLQLVTPDLNWECGGVPNIATVEGQRAIDALVTDDTKLIIADNLSSLMRSGVENDAESWLPLQTWALRHRAQGRSVLFIHHAGKGGAQRGTSRREDVLDTVVAIRRPNDYGQHEGARFEVHIEKGRSLFGKDAEPFEAQLIEDAHGVPAWAIKDIEGNRKKQIEEMIAMGMKPGEIAQELGVNKTTVYRAIKSADKTNSHGAGGHA